MKLIFHIGMPKTGSTSLQTFLCNNNDALRNQGIIYEPEAFNCCLNHNKYFRNTTDEAVSFLKERIEKHKNYPYYLVSTEIIFSIPKEKIKLLKKFINDYDIDFVLYLRRQDDLFDSLFKQRVKIGKRQLKIDAESIDSSFSNDYAPENSDYKKIIQKWEIFDHCTFHVLKYSPQHTIQQFLSLYNINLDVKKSTKENISQSRNAAELANEILWNIDEKLTPCRRELTELLQDFYEPDAEAQNKSTHIYSLEERHNIMAYYAESNDYISRRFFDGGPLFPPLPDEEPDEDVYPALTVQKTVHMLSKILFYYARSNSQIKKLMAYAEESGEFDKEFYEATYGGKRQDMPYAPLEHFVRYGMQAKLKPNADFDNDKILEEFPELQHSGIPPFIIHLVSKAMRKSGM